jgi:hypothetical protein
VTGDFSRTFSAPQGRLFYIDPAVTPFEFREFRLGANARPLGMFLKGFGEDPAGEIYVMASTRLGPSGAAALVMHLVPCYADCDQSTSGPVLSIDDFMCYMNLFASGSPGANCDLSTGTPALNVLDFVCFMGSFAGGCP